MLRKAVCAIAVFAFSVGLVFAAEIRGVITKVSADGKTITVGKFDRQTKMVTEEKEYKVSPDVKVLKGKFSRQTKSVEAGEPIQGGLSNDMFKNLSGRGVRANITTDDSGHVTQIVAMSGRGKKNKQ